jgi:hypothetical protein
MPESSAPNDEQRLQITYDAHTDHRANLQARWRVELFFLRWVKMHLRIKALRGTSENVVKT